MYIFSTYQHVNSCEFEHTKYLHLSINMYKSAAQPLLYTLKLYPSIVLGFWLGTHARELRNHQ